MTSLNVLKITEAANMGDHAQDITAAIEVDPTMTIGDLVAETLHDTSWQGDKDPRYDRYLVIRVAEPVAKRNADAADFLL